MSERKETSDRVVIRHDDRTENWEKNRPGGVTTSEGHTTHYHDSGNVVNDSGRIIGNTKK